MKGLQIPLILDRVMRRKQELLSEFLMAAKPDDDGICVPTRVQ